LGKSGLYQKFDFLISKSKKEPERLIKAINSPRQDFVNSAIMAYEDTFSVRKNSEGIIILNDDKPIDSKLISAIEKYDLIPVKWSERQNYVTKFAA